MKFLSLLLLSPAAFAAPDYPVPGNAARAAVECTTFETVKVKRGEGWSEWQNETHTENFTRTVWVKGNSSFTLDTSPSFTRYTEASPLHGAEQKETLENWALVEGEWQLEAFQRRVNLLPPNEKGIVRRVEETDLGSFYWDVTTGDVDGQLFTEKTLLNPSALSIPERKVSEHKLFCHQGSRED